MLHNVFELISHKFETLSIFDGVLHIPEAKDDAGAFHSARYETCSGALPPYVQRGLNHSLSIEEYENKELYTHMNQVVKPDYLQ